MAAIAPGTTVRGLVQPHPRCLSETKTLSVRPQWTQIDGICREVIVESESVVIAMVGSDRLHLGACRTRNPIAMGFARDKILI